MGVKHNQTNSYLRPPFLGTPLVRPRFIMQPLTSDIHRQPSLCLDAPVCRSATCSAWKACPVQGYGLAACTCQIIRHRRCPGTPYRLVSERSRRIPRDGRDILGAQGCGVCFRMWGFKLLHSKPLTHISFRCEVSTPSALEANQLSVSNPTSSNTTSLNSRISGSTEQT